MRYGVMTTTSKDKPGLVAKRTEFLRNCGANLFLGYGQQLGRMFAFDVLFEADNADMNRIAAGIAEHMGSAAPRFIEVPAPVAYRDPNAHQYSLSTTSEDKLLILSKLTEAVTTHGSSIVDLTASTYEAPDSGVVLFEVTMQLDIPNSIAVRNLRAECSDLERYMGWDVTLESARHRSLQIRTTAPYPLIDRSKRMPSPAPTTAAMDAKFADPVEWAVLSTVSPDRPGIIASNARFLGQRKASIHSQVSKRIGSLFSSHCLFKATAADMDCVKRDYEEELANYQPTLVNAPAPVPFQDDLDMDLTVQAIDEPGVLSGVSEPIMAHGASITALSFGLYPGATNPRGRPLFIAELNLRVRDYIASRHIEAELLKLEQKRGWEIDYRAVKRQFEKPSQEKDS